MTRVQFPVVSGQTIQVRVGAQNDVGFQSALSSPTSIIINPSTTAPGVPTSFTISSTALSIVISYINPINKDLRGVELWWSTSAGGTYVLYDTMGGVPGEESKFNLNWGDVVNGITFVLGTSYYFKLRAVSTSGVTSSYTANSSGVYGTVNTGQVTQNAISSMFNSVVSSNASISTVRDSISYSTNGGTTTSTLQGIIISEITLGAVDSGIAGFNLIANAMVQKKSTWSPNAYSTGVVLQKIAGESYYEQATGFGSSTSFLGEQEPSGQNFVDGVQATYSTSSIDTSGDVIGTTGSKYALFLYTNGEPSFSLGVFSGTGLTITELKR